jgi:hypothetical protein
MGTINFDPNSQRLYISLLKSNATRKDRTTTSSNLIDVYIKNGRVKSDENHPIYGSRKGVQPQLL